MLVNNKYHLSYCSNIHAADSWEDTFASLKKYIPAIKNKVSPDAPFGIGLRLSNLASVQLGLDENMHQFKKWLNRNNLYVYTINSFSYGSLHNKKVKDFVYAPDWTSLDRVAYTVRLAKQLAILLPPNVVGSISTCPISYKHWHFEDETLLNNTLKKSADNLCKVVAELYKIEIETGKTLHLDLEPEPDGLLENSLDVINFFRGYLAPAAIEIFEEKLAINAEKAEFLIYNFVNVCYDVGHFSLAYEEPETTFKRFRQTGIKVGKIQMTSALKMVFETKEDQQKIWDTLSLFNAEMYLHQVTELVDNKVVTYPDLRSIFLNPKAAKELRAHFPVPIFLEKFGNVVSTQDHILKVMEYLKNHEVTDTIEVETYTWEVLPSELKTNLFDSITRELFWAKEKLTAAQANNVKRV